MNGALLIDKPQGITSAGVLRCLERHFSIKGFGHAGTLDPMATGLLIVLCGAATKLQSLFLESEKMYEGSIKVGLRTDTDDVEGRTLAEDRELAFLSRGSLDEWRARILETFSGGYAQRPPSFSAVKSGGKKSYQLARAGKVMELTPRSVEITFLHLEFTDASRIEYRIRCSKGTYVRSLARDIGELLGSGACLESIRRLSSGGFQVCDALPLERLMADSPEAHLLGMGELVAGLPRVELGADECRRLRQGIQTPLAGISEEQLGDAELAALFSASGEFQGMAEKVPVLRENRSWRVRFLLPQSTV